MAKAQTLSELADNIVERQLGLKEQAALVRKQATDVKHRCHMFQTKPSAVESEEWWLT